MPKSSSDIAKHGAELAAWFERVGPDPSTVKDAAELRALSRAVIARGAAEENVTSAVSEARAAGHSWALIGLMLGTTGEAARQRYGNALRCR